MSNNLENIYKELGDHVCLFPYMSAFYSQGVPESVRPCSLIDFDSRVKNNNLIDSLNQPEWLDIREHFNHKTCHETAGCLTCSLAERKGGDSPRQLNNKYFAEHVNIDIVEHVKQIKKNNYQISELICLDYDPSNYCNFECVMCSSNASSTRAAFEIKFYKQNHRSVKFEHKDHFYPLLNNVEILNFAGGEPLLQPEIHKLIDYLVEHDLAKNITISLLTNASKYPVKLIHQFKQFKNVFYTVSIDGINEVIEYQRRGCKWEETEKIALNLIKDFGCVVNHVVTAINVFSFIETVDWFFEHDIDIVILSLVATPEPNKNFSVNAIPLDIRNNLLDKLRANTKKYPSDKFNNLIIQMISILENNQFDPKVLSIFKKSIAIEDIVSKRKLIDVVPEWRPYFND